MAGKFWSHGEAFGGITLDRDGEHFAMIEVDSRCAYSTALKKARRMVRLLNAGEAALTPAISVSALDTEGRIKPHHPSTVWREF